MRDVNFIEVGMENFGPYIERMILTFENNALTLITGPNGIGKTMALDALPFTLFGTTSKGAKGDDVVNNVVGRNCYTWAQFLVDQDNYLVERYHKYTKLGNTVTISKNGEKPYKKGQKEVLPEIERLLCPHKSFMNTLMFGQKVKDFFTDLVDSDKKEIFRKILNLSRYQIFYERVKEILKDLEQKMWALKNDLTVKEDLLKDRHLQVNILNEKKKQFLIDKDHEINNLQQSIAANNLLLENWKRKLTNLQANRQDWEHIKRKLLECDAEEEKLKAQIKVQDDKLITEKELKLSELKSKAKDSQSKIEQTYYQRQQDKKDYFIKLTQQLTTKIEHLMEEKNKVDIDINKHLDFIHNSEIQIDELKVGLNHSTCPTCLQDITKECEETLKYKIEQHFDTASEARQLIDSEFTPAKKAIMQKIDSISNDKIKSKEIMHGDLKDIELIYLQDLQNSDQKLNNAFDKVDKIFESISDNIKKISEQGFLDFYEKKQKYIMESQAHERLDNEIDETEMAITTIERTRLQKILDLAAKEALEFDEDQIYSYTKNIRQLEIDIKNIESESKQIQDDVEIFEFWKSAFSPSGIPSMLIDEAVPFMNEKVSEYLDKLTNGRYIVSFDTLAETKKGEFRDKISVNVLDTHTRASSRIQLSGGQTRIIDIATILTLGDLQSNIQDVKFNILLFDEIFDSLDEENIGFVSKVLSNMKIGKSIYLISHRHEDQLEADEVLTLN
jgi:exonuclease SbcC